MQEKNPGGGSEAPPCRSVSEEGRRGAAAAPRLDKRTHLDEARYRISLINYGNGLGEIGWSFIPALKPSKVGKGLSTNREANEDRAIRRARSRLRKLILSAKLDHLLTLTYRENVTNFDQACRDLGRFLRLLRERLPNLVYVTVAERQQRGAWHWHLAVRGRQNVDLLRTCWREVVGEGNIDVKPPKGNGNYRQLALVKYLGKYLAKGFTEGNRELNARRFRASLGITVPQTSIALPLDQRGNTCAYAVEVLKAQCGEVGHIWESQDFPAGWACSWK